MSRYTIEYWPPMESRPFGGLTIPKGAKVTDKITGHCVVADKFRAQFQNKDAAIALLEALDDVNDPVEATRRLRAGKEGE